jgi:hypothetical protein
MMSGYNLAAVVAGLPEEQLRMAPTPLPGYVVPGAR